MKFIPHFYRLRAYIGFYRFEKLEQTTSICTSLRASRGHYGVTTQTLGNDPRPCLELGSSHGTFGGGYENWI